MFIMLDIKAELKSFIARNGTSIKKVVLALNEKEYITTGYNNVLNKINNGNVSFKDAQYILDHLGYELKIVEKK